MSEYKCEICNYSTNYIQNYNRHINSSKHKNKVCPPKKVIKKKTFVCECGKKYKFQSGLSKHKHKCKFGIEEVCKVIQKVELTDDEKTENQVLKEHIKTQEKQIKQLIELQISNSEKFGELTEATKKIAENGGGAGNNYTDCYNQKMTINVFLNEECKNAMNLTDFVDQFKVSLEDLQYTRDNGFAQGITNIFTKQLKDMDPTTRPIHCSDSKRLQFYVKDENEWVKDSDGKQLDSTINKIKIKQANSLTEWELEHPDFIKDPKLTDEWCSMMAKIAPESKNDIPKIKRSFAKYFE